MKPQKSLALMITGIFVELVGMDFSLRLVEVWPMDKAEMLYKRLGTIDTAH